MESRMVKGRELVPLGIIAGRTIYGFTSDGEAYRLTPDTHAAYLLRRTSDGYSGIFGSLEEALTYVDTFEQQSE